MNRSKRNNTKSRPRIPTAARTSATNSSIGTLVGKVANVAKSIPVFGNVVDVAETAASSLLSFLGLGSSLFQVQYNATGSRFCLPHSHVMLDEKSNSYYSNSTLIIPGSILMRYELSIGPAGSRSRRMGENFEKYQLLNFQLAVTPTCAATEPGQLAYVFVPDPLDKTLDSMDESKRLEAVLGRDNVQLAQIWQNTLLTFSLPASRQYFVQPETGDVRFSSPGAVYVIAVTNLDPLKLPTLRQTSSLRFSRATSAPLSNGLELVRLAVQTSTTPTKTSTFYDKTAIGVGFNSARYTQKVFGDITADVIRVYKGETVNAAMSTTSTFYTQYPVGNCIVHHTTDGGLTSNLSVHLSVTNTGSGTASVPYTAVFYGVMPTDGFVWVELVGTLGLTTQLYSHTGIIAIIPDVSTIPLASISASTAMTSHNFANGLRCIHGPASSLQLALEAPPEPYEGKYEVVQPPVLSEHTFRMSQASPTPSQACLRGQLPVHK